MNEAHIPDPMNPFKHNTALATVCFEANAFFRHQSARKHIAFVTPVVGEHTFIIRQLPDGAYVDSGIYRFTHVSDRDGFNSTRKVTAERVNQDDDIVASERLSKHYHTLAYGLTLKDTLTGTFTPEGYVWEDGYTDLRQYVLSRDANRKGNMLFQQGMTCFTLRHPFAKTWLDSNMLYPYAYRQSESEKWASYLIPGGIVFPTLFLCTGHVLTSLLLGAVMTFSLSRMIYTKQYYTAYSQHHTHKFRLLRVYDTLVAESSDDKKEMRYKAQILSEIARAFPYDSHIVEWHIFMFNRELEATSPDKERELFLQFVSSFVRESKE